MFRQVLVPLDFTPKNEAAVAVARSVTAVDGTLTLLHVIERIGEETDGELDAFYARLEERSGERMTA
ncbi:MAG TPA: universal stress protein, partial [Thermoanaerobaculia bacterium]|nr:universal stress protein [Thermoanaerobaculia bacterium]